jgi:hypothetical protein
MYPPLLYMHSYLRWLALGAILFVFVRALLGLAQGGAWKGTDTMWAKAAAHLTTVQLVVGILLYAVSPYVRDLLDNMGATMQNSVARFFAVEHAFVMVLALGAVHMGAAMAKKGKTDKAKFTRVAIAFGIAIALIGYGIPWSRPLFRLGM